MEQILRFIKRYIPKSVFHRLQPAYHRIMGRIAALYYRKPSDELIVIGVTGTTGKTTVVYMLAQILNDAGVKTGYTSTAMFGDGNKEWLNDKKMTMIGRFFTQRMLRRMVDNGCKVAIVETTSEGAVQYRHRDINYDLFVFTGLYPEHIDSHGSFENYKAAKLSLFEHLSRSAKKSKIPNCPPKTLIVNGDDGYAAEFLQFDVPRAFVFTSKNAKFESGECKFPEELDYVHYQLLESNATGIKIGIDTSDIQLRLLGDFTTLNATAAVTAARAIGLDMSQISKGLASIDGIPGRLERISCGQDFTVVVDYAFEPVAVSELYETVASLAPSRIIHVLGSTGGGRDVSRRGMLGKIAGRKADIVIVTNEDPYDDDPMAIMEDVADGARKANKEGGRTLLLIEDRGEAIAKAISIAEANDVVLITGKGCEQAIAGKEGELLPWDDRDVTRAALKKILAK